MFWSLSELLGFILKLFEGRHQVSFIFVSPTMSAPTRFSIVIDSWADWEYLSLMAIIVHLCSQHAPEDTPLQMWKISACNQTSWSVAWSTAVGRPSSLQGCRLGGRQSEQPAAGLGQVKGHLTPEAPALSWSHPFYHQPPTAKCIVGSGTLCMMWTLVKVADPKRGFPFPWSLSLRAGVGEMWRQILDAVSNVSGSLASSLALLLTCKEVSVAASSCPSRLAIAGERFCRN